MKHSFTSREKILIVIFTLILIGCLYKITVLDYVSSTVSEADDAIEAADVEKQIELAKLEELNRMQSELESIKGTGETLSVIPEYDNLPQIMVFMDSLFAETDDYNLSFNSLSTSGALVRRLVNISFTASSYENAKKMITEIYNCPYRCTISNIAVAVQSGTGSSLSSGAVSTRLTVTFIEILD